MKKCSRCQTNKPLSQFSPNKSSSDGYSYHCKPCAREYRKRYLKGTGPRKRKQKDGMLWCTKCNHFLSPNNFYRDKNAKTGRTSQCKKCSYIPKPRPDIPTVEQRCSKCKVVKPLTDFQKDSGRKYGHDARCKQCRYKGKIPWEYRHLPRTQYNYYKQKAYERNIIFDLSFKDFYDIAQGQCTYCGDTTSLSKYGMGVDRADNTKGYGVNNCVPCCTICNWMKNSLDVNTFHTHIKKIFAHRNLTL